MKATSFEELKIWQSARELCKDIYAIARKEEFSKDFRFVSQITASAGSIMDNIAFPDLNHFNAPLFSFFRRDSFNRFICIAYFA